MRAAAPLTVSLALSLVALASTGVVGLASPTTTVAPTTVAAPTTVVPTTAAPVSLPEPESRDVDPVGTLVPSIVASGDRLGDPDEQLALLAQPANAVAAPSGTVTLCGVVPFAAALTAEVTWERDGDVVREVEAAPRQPPGLVDCIVADADQLDEGTYQFVLTGPTGATSAAPTVVVGADVVDAALRNNGTEPVCLLLVSPRRADRFEAFTLDSPLLPGEVVKLRLAAVEQEAETFECPISGDRLDATADADLSFTPRPGEIVELFPDAGQTPTPQGSAPGTTAPPTTAGPTTTAV